MYILRRFVCVCKYMYILRIVCTSICVSVCVSYHDVAFDLRFHSEEACAMGVCVCVCICVYYILYVYVCVSL